VKTGAHIIPLLVAAGCTMLTLSSSLPASAESLDFRAEPHRIRITESFHGRNVHISAQIPRGAQTVLELKGQVHEENLLLKGRRLGLWMSVGKIKVEGAPSLYLISTTDPKLLSKQDSENRWGYGALRKQVKFSGSIPDPGKEDLFSDYLNLKEHERLYGEYPGAIKVVAIRDQFETIQGQFHLPGNVKPEEYVLSITVLENGRILEQKSIKLQVVMKELTAFLFSLAQQHPTLYGFLAVAVAMVAGLITGFVFKGKGAH
jgi:Putative transmembrane protein (Alph_Pro_TM)